MILLEICGKDLNINFTSLGSKGLERENIHLIRIKTKKKKQKNKF